MSTEQGSRRIRPETIGTVARHASSTAAVMLAALGGEWLVAGTVEARNPRDVFIGVALGLAAEQLASRSETIANKAKEIYSRKRPQS